MFYAIHCLVVRFVSEFLRDLGVLSSRKVRFPCVRYMYVRVCFRLDRTGHIGESTSLLSLACLEAVEVRQDSVGMPFSRLCGASTKS